MSQNHTERVGAKRRPGWFRRIRTRLIVSFSLMFVGVLVITQASTIWGVPLTGYTGTQGRQVAEAFRSLELVADLKKSRLQRVMKARMDNLRVFAGNDAVRVNVARLRATIRDAAGEGLQGEQLWDAIRQEESYRILGDYVRSIARTFGDDQKILVADAETGTILVSTDEQDVGEPVALDRFVDGVSVADDVHVCDIEIRPRTGLPTVRLWRAIEDFDTKTTRVKEGAPGAIMVVDLDPDDILAPILHTGGGLGRTGEALLVTRDARIVASLAHPLADGRTARPREHVLETQPAVRAARGEEGTMEARDYRDEQVLAVCRYVPVTDEWGWGMVVKRDWAEFSPPIRRGIAHTCVIGGVAILFVLVLTAFVSGSVTRPIVALSRAADRVAEGDLDARVPVTGKDEVGTLAVTFNSMVERVQHWHHGLEEQVGLRTFDLHKANERLEAEIAERTRMEAGLRRAEQTWKEIFDAIGHPTVILGPDQRVIAANKAVMEAAGQPEAELIGKKCYEIFHSADTTSPPEGCPFERMCASGHLETVEMEMQAFGGVYLVSCTPVLDEAGRLAKVIHIATDITERKRAEEKLRENEVILKTAMDNSQVGIVIADAPDGRIRYMNQASMLIGGTGESEVVGRVGVREYADTWPTFHFDGTPYRDDEAPLARAVLYGETCSEEFVLRRADEEERVVWAKAAPIRNAQDEVVRGIVVSLDITERKRAEEELKSLTRRNEAILVAVPDIIMEVDANKVYTWANRAGHEFFGTDVLGQKAAHYFAGEQTTYETVEPLFAGAEDVIYVESWQRRRDGEKRLLAWWCRVLKDTDGRVTGALSTARDITERRRAEEELAEHRDRLEELVQERTRELEAAQEELLRSERLATLGQLAGSVAHELRNPLGAIRNAAFYIRGEIGDHKPHWAKHLRIIDEEVSVSDRIIRDLLDMSRGKVPQRQRCDLGEILGAAWDRADLPPTVERRVDFQPDPFEVYADATLMIQVLANLFTNAAQAMEGNGRIRLAARRHDEYDQVVVEDTGPGVPAENRDHVFELLFTTKAKGTGLGLPICKQIVERHGGTLELLDTPEPGAAFRIRLPRAR